MSDLEEYGAEEDGGKENGGEEEDSPNASADEEPQFLELEAVPVKKIKQVCSYNMTST